MKIWTYLEADEVDEAVADDEIEALVDAARANRPFGV